MCTSCFSVFDESFWKSGTFFCHSSNVFFFIFLCLSFFLRFSCSFCWFFLVSMWTFSFCWFFFSLCFCWFCFFCCNNIFNPSTKLFGFWMVCKSLFSCKVLVTWCCITSDFGFLIIPVRRCNLNFCYKSSAAKVSVTWCSETSDSNFLCVPVSCWNFTESFVKFT